MIVRPSDVPTYVEYGAVDAGIVGADILMEQAADVYEPLNLGFGFCRLVVATPQAAVATQPLPTTEVGGGRDDPDQVGAFGYCGPQKTQAGGKGPWLYSVESGSRAARYGGDPRHGGQGAAFGGDIAVKRSF